ncbi:hypothetical protein D3C83_31460 [compost metagenome]
MTKEIFVVTSPQPLARRDALFLLHRLLCNRAVMMQPRCAGAADRDAGIPDFIEKQRILEPR